MTHAAYAMRMTVTTSQPTFERGSANHYHVHPWSDLEQRCLAITIVSHHPPPLSLQVRPPISSDRKPDRLCLNMAVSFGEEDLLQLNQKQFDFNIQFEQLFFSIIPSALFIITSLWRTLAQAQKPIVVYAPVFQGVKVVSVPNCAGDSLAPTFD